MVPSPDTAAHRLQTVTDFRSPKRLTYTYSLGGRRTSLTDSDGIRTNDLYTKGRGVL